MDNCIRVITPEGYMAAKVPERIMAAEKITPPTFLAASMIDWIDAISGKCVRCLGARGGDPYDKEITTNSARLQQTRGNFQPEVLFRRPGLLFR